MNGKGKAGDIPGFIEGDFVRANLTRVSSPAGFVQLTPSDETKMVEGGLEVAAAVIKTDPSFRDTLLRVVLKERGGLIVGRREGCLRCARGAMNALLERVCRPLLKLSLRYGLV